MGFATVAAAHCYRLRHLSTGELVATQALDILAIYVSLLVKPEA